MQIPVLVERVAGFRSHEGPNVYLTGKFFLSRHISKVTMMREKKELACKRLRSTRHRNAAFWPDRCQT